MFKRLAERTLGAAWEPALPASWIAEIVDFLAVCVGRTTRSGIFESYMSMALSEALAVIDQRILISTSTKELKNENRKQVLQ